MHGLWERHLSASDWNYKDCGNYSHHDYDVLTKYHADRFMSLLKCLHYKEAKPNWYARIASYVESCANCHFTGSVQHSLPRRINTIWIRFSLITSSPLQVPELAMQSSHLSFRSHREILHHHSYPANSKGSTICFLEETNHRSQQVCARKSQVVKIQGLT